MRTWNNYNNTLLEIYLAASTYTTLQVRNLTPMSGDISEKMYSYIWQKFDKNIHRTILIIPNLEDTQMPTNTRIVKMLVN